jgi:hypothetical protein
MAIWITICDSDTAEVHQVFFTDETLDDVLSVIQDRLSVYESVEELEKANLEEEGGVCSHCGANIPLSSPPMCEWCRKKLETI